MSYKVLVCGGDSGISQLIKNILRDAEMLANQPKPNIEIINDDGWYRKFEKQNKRKNFTKK